MMKIIDLNSKVVKNGMWLVVLQIFNMVVPLLTIPYITRVLGTTNYGIFSLALNWVTYIQVIVEYGFAFTGARQVSISSDNNLQKLFSRIITARLILMSFSYVTVNIFGYLLSIDNVSMIKSNSSQEKESLDDSTEEDEEDDFESELEDNLDELVEGDEE